MWILFLKKCARDLGIMLVCTFFLAMIFHYYVAWHTLVLIGGTYTGCNLVIAFIEHRRNLKARIGVTHQ